MAEFMTTAAALLAYEKELREGGFGPELVDDLVRAAGDRLVTAAGLGVRND